MPLFPMSKGIEGNAGYREAVPDGSKIPTPALRLPASIQVKNRRKRYLDQHPEYFSSELEMAGPRLLSCAAFLT
jgi:hypothetical protein